MNSAEYIARLIRPDLAAFRTPPSRSRWGRWWHGRSDARLSALFVPAPHPSSRREWFAETALEWTYNYIQPIPDTRAEQPQTAAQTLNLRTGDCEDGAVLLASMLVSGLHPDAWPFFRFCVGNQPGARDHAYLEMDRPLLNDTVLLDWTLAPRPLASAEAHWRTTSEVSL